MWKQAFVAIVILVVFSWSSVALAGQTEGPSEPVPSSVSWTELRTRGTAHIVTGAIALAIGGIFLGQEFYLAHTRKPEPESDCEYDDDCECGWFGCSGSSFNWNSPSFLMGIYLPNLVVGMTLLFLGIHERERANKLRKTWSSGVPRVGLGVSRRGDGGMLTLEWRF